MSGMAENEHEQGGQSPNFKPGDTVYSDDFIDGKGKIHKCYMRGEWTVERVYYDGKCYCVSPWFKRDRKLPVPLSVTFSRRYLCTTPFGHFRHPDDPSCCQFCKFCIVGI